MQATEAAPAGRPGSRRRGRSGSAKVGEPGRAAEREQGRRGGHQGRGRGARGALGGAGRGGSCRAAREPGLSGSDSEMDRITPFAGQRFVLLALGPAAAAAAAVRAGAGEFRDRSQGETRDRGIAPSAHYLDRLFRLIVTSFICLSFKAGFPMRGKTVSEARLTLWVRDGGGGTPSPQRSCVRAGACVCVGVVSYLHRSSLLSGAARSPAVHEAPGGGLVDRSQLAGGRPRGRGGLLGPPPRRTPPPGRTPKGRKTPGAARKSFFQAGPARRCPAHRQG